jgi:hypothetical protein
MLLSLAIAPLDGTVMIGNYADAMRQGYGYSLSILDSESRKMIKGVEDIIKDDNLVSWDAAKLTGDILLRFKGLNLSSAYNLYEGIAGGIKDGLDANDAMTLLNMPKTEKRAYAANIKEGESLTDYAGRVAKAYDNEKMFQRYISQYINKYYFHEDDGDMTGFNRVLEKAKRWDKLRKEKTDSEEFKELDRDNVDWEVLLGAVDDFKDIGKHIIAGNPKAAEQAKSPKFAEYISVAKGIIKKHELALNGK